MPTMKFRKYKVDKGLALIVLLLLNASVSKSADRNLSNLKVEMLSAVEQVSQVLLRTNTCPDLSGTIDSSQWLKIPRTSKRFSQCC